MAGVKEALVSILRHILLTGIINLVSAQNCFDNGNFTTNSTYGKNRDILLASLPPNVSENGGFFNASFGQGPNKVYAIGLCRGDYTQDKCYSTINKTVHDIIAKCTNQKQALYWGGENLVRYSDRSFFGTFEPEYSEAGYNTGDITSNLTQFDTIWESLLDSVVKKASMGSSRLKYATGEADYTAFQRIHALMQCTPDLSQEDCDSCLRQCASRYVNCCHGKQGGFVKKANCWLRWDLYPFYTPISGTIAPSLSPPPPPELGRIPPPPPESGSPPPAAISTKSNGISSRTIVIIVVPIIVIMVVVCILAVVLPKRTKKKNKGDQNDRRFDEESLQFDLNEVRVATENFSDTNMLGKGGFGTVYKGTLQNGQEIAVKRLCGNSSQGQQEFKNEVLLLAKLHHRNLVRLLGFNMEDKERILIYEFLPNESLDKFIFDPVRRLLLNWEKRYKIIEGIAKELLYLHEDSPYRIIHRDLKTANILLDAEMFPKISDFGTAKLFAVDQTQDDTSRIVGTYGYMAPEYAHHGNYSTKSDVYGFGVMLLEIICGKKISSSFTEEKVGQSLLTHAWKNWNQGTPMEIIDPILRDCSSSEIKKCIHLGLLCVQENIANRPTMASVVLMLGSNSISIPVPSRPAFAMDSTIEETETMFESSISDESKSGTVNVSVNEVSISELDPR